MFVPNRSVADRQEIPKSYLALSRAAPGPAKPIYATGTARCLLEASSIGSLTAPRERLKGQLGLTLRSSIATLQGPVVSPVSPILSVRPACSSASHRLTWHHSGSARSPR